MKLVKPIELFRRLLKDSKLSTGRLLGLDVGTKYVGVAISDTDNLIASPLSVLVRKKTNIEFMAKDFKTLVTEFSCAGLVIGSPHDMSGSDNPQAVEVKIFVHEIKKTRELEGVDYTFWDERFTSKSIEALLKPLDLHHVHCKTILDKFAAVGILQGFLDYANGNLNAESGAMCEQSPLSSQETCQQ